MSMSYHKCCVPGCIESGSSHKTLHIFPNPNKERERFNDWVFAVKGDIIGLSNEDIYKLRRVCHAHFEEKFCCRFNRISNIAVPTLNMPGSLSIPKFTFTERRSMKEVFSPNKGKQLEVSATVTDPVLTLQNSEESLTSTKSAFAARHPLQQIQASLDFEPTPSSSKAESLMSTKSAFAARNPLRQIQVGLVLEPTPSSSKADFEVMQPQEPLESNKENSAYINCTIPKLVKTRNSAKKYQSNAAINKNKGCYKGKAVKKNLYVTPAEKKLYDKLIKQRVKLSKCRNKLKLQSANIKAAKNIISNPRFLETLENFTSAAKIFILMQFRECKKKGKGRRFTLDEKIMALSILKQAPKGYRNLRKIFILPAPQTLKKLISEANITPGINKKIFQQLKNVTNEMKTEDKLCIVLFDEMCLKASVSYNEKRDKTVGFVTNGEVVKQDFADHAQVFMVRGLMKNFKQPVAYSFSAAATKGPELAIQIKDIIKELQEAGLIVMATVCDQGANNQNAIKLLLQEARGYYLRKGEEPKHDVFIVNDCEIVPLYDPPHLLKCVRNNLLTKHLQYVINGEKKTAKWEHIVKLYQENPGYRGVRIIPKLSDEHVFANRIQKMKVKFASQVFSRNVGTNMGYLAGKGILPKECTETADTLLFFDNLFDSQNGSDNKKDKAHGKPLLGPVTPNSVHHKQWADAIKTLKQMSFINVTTGLKEKVPTLKNWAWTLEGTEVLLKKLEIEYGVTSVWMRHLNQDPIENFFGAIRSHGCRNTNPTPERFEAAFTTLLINNMSSIHAPIGSNCEKDFCEALYALIVGTDADDCKATATCDFHYLPNIQIEGIDKKSDPRIIGPLQYVSGYFLRNAKKKIFKACLHCAKNVFSKEGHEYIKFREYAGRNWLCSPTEAVVECISGIQDIANAILKEHLEKNHLKELMKTHIFMFLDFDFLDCREHKEDVINYIINLSIRFFTFHYCKDLNKMLSGKRQIYDYDDMFQIKACKYFKKCCKRKIK